MVNSHHYFNFIIYCVQSSVVEDIVNPISYHDLCANKNAPFTNFNYFLRPLDYAIDLSSKLESVEIELSSNIHALVFALDFHNCFHFLIPCASPCSSSLESEENPLSLGIHASFFRVTAHPLSYCYNRISISQVRVPRTPSSTHHHSPWYFYRSFHGRQVGRHTWDRWGHHSGAHCTEAQAATCACCRWS